MLKWTRAWEEFEKAMVPKILLHQTRVVCQKVGGGGGGGGALAPPFSTPIRGFMQHLNSDEHRL